MITPLHHTIEQAMTVIELAQLRKGAEVMARHILSRPATGAEAICEARRIANDVMAAKGLDEVQP
jgi:hypothetical protein